ncbi:hypothetical protein QYF61_018433 [Mycteria americana]|uniref:Uncharacterized protein n=1 Tax=Mycteria americana TaxID=33587 RepID=A0AAN7RJZ7_MYCAM|nr:hypothetical protein QYF61_018433 [Mycteria americana]
MDLSMATDTSGCPAPAWTHPQVTVPLTQVHTRVPACPVQQHRKRCSDVLAICQPRRMAIAVITMFPGTAESDDKQYSSTASSKSKKQPLTSTRLYSNIHIDEQLEKANWTFYLFIHLEESQNRIGWKRPLRSSSPTVNLTLPRPPLHHVPKHLIQTSFKYLHGWRLNHFPGQPVPMLDNPFSEEKFPNIQSKPPLAQLEAISSCPITCYLGEETDPHLSTASFQVVVESDKVSPQPPFLQAKQPQFPQPLLIRLLLQTLHQLRCPSLDTLQPLNVSLVVGGPKLNTVFEGHNHFPSPAGHTISDTSQDAIGFLGHLGTLPAHVQLAVNQHPQVLFRQAAFQPLFPEPVALHGVVMTQVQDPALSLVEPHTIDLGPSIQPVQRLPTLKQINTPTQLGVICKLTESTLDPLVQIIDKDIKQNWPQN